MGHRCIVILLILAAPLSWGEERVCEVTDSDKKTGEIRGIERCKQNDTIVYYGKGIPFGMRTLPKYCHADTIKSEEYVNLVALKKDLHFFITCSARGQALLARPE